MIEVKTVIDAVSARKTWEERQRLLYVMRRDGLRRKNKPYPKAADMHFKLIDTAIEKFKPFYYQQIFGNARLAQFVSKEMGALAKEAESVTEWFDYTLREETEFETEALHATDNMLLHGRGIIKPFHDVQKRRLAFESVHPLFFIVPTGTINLLDADWMVHVRELSVGQYQRNPTFNQKVIERIKCHGNGDNESAGIVQYAQEKSISEGLVSTPNEEGIVLWEVYERTQSGWDVHTVSPLQDGLEVKPSFKMELEQEGQLLCPFAPIQMEVTEKGWYAARGIAERIAGFEAYLCKIWSMKADFLDFSAKPMFNSQNPLAQNSGNIKFVPGEVLPNGLQPVQMPNPPMSLDDEMINARMAAESTISMPDFGVGGQDTGKSNKTATEVEYMRVLTSTGVDLKARIFRIGLRDCYRSAYAILRQFDQEQMLYFLGKDLKTLNPESLKATYRITPDGAPDDWNKGQRLQRAVNRFQMFKGHPNVDQEELVQDVIAADDARLVERLYLPGNLKASNETEDEAFELLLLEQGFPAQAKPDEDHALRINVLVQRLEALTQLGTQFDPIAGQRIQEHIAQHLMLLKQVNPKLANQIIQSLTALEAPEQAGPVANPQIQQEPPDMGVAS
jgi:hypothetical protein